MGIRVEGLNQLAAELKKLPDRMQRTVVAKALRAGGRAIQKATLPLIPVGTGTLKREQRKAKNVRRGRKRKGELSAIVAPPARADLGIPPQAKYYYPGGLEYGTKRGIEATRYIARGFAAGEGEARRVITQTLKQEIEKAFAKIATKTKVGLR